MISRVFLASLVFVAVCSAINFPHQQDFEATSDQITNLPGLNDSINFKQYSGYVTVDQSHGRKLFYWFVESQRNPSTDKVVLWLNGGPGCSSLGGLFEENGPFRPQPNGKDLFLNPQSWNRVANVIYLESPSGVGFSYSDTKSDYNTGDQQTAQDAYNFLQTFFQMYPQFSSLPFWISGESYAGHYIPELAKYILDENAAGNKYINLEGFMAGNPWTYAPIDNYGAVFYWWTHALISDESFYGMNSTCDFADIGPLKKRSVSPDSIECNKYVAQATNEMGNINIYDIYVDVCPIKSGYLDQLAKYSPFHQTVQENMGDYIDPAYQPCLDNHLFEYLNRADVQQAIHANISYPWMDCSVIVNYNYTDVLSSVIPLYQYFQENTKLKILVYSGDVDAIVPYTGTRQWIADLDWTVEIKWKEWVNSNGQVNGYVTVYDGLTFATVRDAGHMVPETQPERAFQMFSSFLYNYVL